MILIHSKCQTNPTLTTLRTISLSWTHTVTLSHTITLLRCNYNVKPSCDHFLTLILLSSFILSHSHILALLWPFLVVYRLFTLGLLPSLIPILLPSLMPPISPTLHTRKALLGTIYIIYHSFKLFLLICGIKSHLITFTLILLLSKYCTVTPRSFHPVSTSHTILLSHTLTLIPPILVYSVAHLLLSLPYYLTLTPLFLRSSFLWSLPIIFNFFLFTFLLLYIQIIGQNSC